MLDNTHPTFPKGFHKNISSVTEFVENGTPFILFQIYGDALFASSHSIRSVIKPTGLSLIHIERNRRNDHPPATSDHETFMYFLYDVALPLCLPVWSCSIMNIAVNAALNWTSKIILLEYTCTQFRSGHPKKSLQVKHEKVYINPHQQA